MVGNRKLYYRDRATGRTEEEKIFCERSLRFLNSSPLGKWLNYPLASIPWFSSLIGWWFRRPQSRKKIAPFIEKHGVDPAEFEESVGSFRSFDDFFIRKLKPSARPLASGLIAPAEGRYLAFQNIDSCDGFIVKEKKFTLEKLLKNNSLAHKYRHGSMVIVRLCPSDYHRFHFPIDCVPATPELINGPLFSVNPLALQENIERLVENKRMITELKTENYGTLLFIEIGATSVGSIHQTFTPHRPAKKGEEKGYFSFGGSCIILLFEENTIQLAPDLLRNSSEYIETRVLFGQSLEK